MASHSPFQRRLRNPLRRADRRAAAAVPARRLHPAQPVHARQHVLRLRVRHLRDARGIREGRAVHRHRHRARHARRPHRAHDWHDQRVRAPIRFARRRRSRSAWRPRSCRSSGGWRRSGGSGGRAAFLFVTAAALRLARFNIQAPDRRQALLRRHAEPGGGGRARRDGVPVSRRPARSRSEALPALAMVIVPGTADGQHDPLPQLQVASTCRRGGRSACSSCSRCSSRCWSRTPSGARSRSRTGTLAVGLRSASPSDAAAARRSLRRPHRARRRSIRSSAFSRASAAIRPPGCQI